MFKDYYKILDISISADNAEIKRAYRHMSIKWHPDKNLGVEVTSTMQDINEAYAILKDPVKKSRYDEEYHRFREAFDQKETTNYKVKKEEKNASQYKWTYEYDVQDEDLKDDIKNAREYARELVEKFLKELKESSIGAAKGAATNAFNYAVAWVAAGIIITIIGGLLRTCK